MLKVQRAEKGTAVLFKLSGIVNETTDLTKLLGPPPAECHIQCAEIDRMNSVGVKGWVTYFEGAKRSKCKLAFYECSPAIVEQLNMMTNFLGGGKVVSIQLPFLCEKCGHRVLETRKVVELKKIGGLDSEERPCPKCQGTATFEDMPEDYFRFLERIEVSFP